MQVKKSARTPEIAKTRQKITSVLTRVHVSICTQYKARNFF
jgi:hypothetical protein